MSARIHEYGVTQLERSNPLKQEEKEVASSEIGRDVPVVLLVSFDLNRGLCPGPLSLLGRHSFLAPLAETHGPDSEAKLVCEVSTSH